MRLLFFTHYFPPEVNAPANRTFEHCREWVRMGHEVHVVTCVPSHPRGVPFSGYRRVWYQRETMEGIIVHRVWTYLAPNLGKFRRALNYFSYIPSALWRALRLGRFDLLIATSPQFFCAVAGWLAAGLKRMPWVFELRDLWPDSIASVGAMQKGLVLRSLERIELRMYRSARGVACVTRSFQDNLETRGIDRSKCAYLPNGVDITSWLGGDRQKIRRRYGVAPEEMLLSYVGSVGMAHGIGTLLEAAKFLAKEGLPVRFLIVGDGAELDSLRAKAVEWGIDTVTFTGLVPHSEIRDHLAATDVALVILRDRPLFRTVLPSKMFEAMGSGKPIVLGVEGEARDVLERAGCGIPVPPEDPVALAEAIRSLAGSEKKRVALGEAGRLFVESEFSRSVWARRYMEWLEEQVLGTGHRDSAAVDMIGVVDNEPDTGSRGSRKNYSEEVVSASSKRP